MPANSAGSRSAEAIEFLAGFLGTAPSGRRYYRLKLWSTENDLPFHFLPPTPIEAPMTVQTSKISGRREVSFQSLADIQADAERLAAQPVELLGNWSLGQIFDHLAMGMEMSIDGFPMKAAAPIRWIARLFVKPRILKHGMKPGFQLPASSSALLPGAEVTTEAGLAHLKKAIARLGCEPTNGWHPIFGKMTPAESHLLQLRHAEMHLSLVIPRESDSHASET